MKAPCSFCGGSFGVRNDGRTRGHGPTGQACPGSGLFPEHPRLTIGLDWWHVASHHGYFLRLTRAHQRIGDRVMIISAIGRSRIGTVEAEARAAGYPPSVSVHEVVFPHPSDSPRCKLAMCRQLGVSVYYDDRSDVCELLSANGILAMRVPRKVQQDDISAERA